MRHLTILTMAVQKKTLPYDDLMDRLAIENVRHLEDVIIEAMYAGEELITITLRIVAKLFISSRIDQRKIRSDEPSTGNR